MHANPNMFVFWDICMCVSVSALCVSLLRVRVCRLENEMIPRLLLWMEAQVEAGVLRPGGDGDDGGPCIPVEELLRFLIVFGYPGYIHLPTHMLAYILVRRRERARLSEDLSSHTCAANLGWNTH